MYSGRPKRAQQIKFAAKFLDSKDPNEANVKKLLAGLEGIYLKTFEFKRAGEWPEADRSKIVSVTEHRGLRNGRDLRAQREQQAG